MMGWLNARTVPSGAVLKKLEMMRIFWGNVLVPDDDKKNMI
jgi:hypothetical protein